MRNAHHPFSRYRASFPALQNTVYLISHSLGAMPEQTRSYMNRFLQRWAEEGIRAWELEWWDLPIQVGNKLAALIGAPPGSVSTHQNVTLAEAVILSCFRFDEPRRKIVFSELNFPSVMYLYYAHQELGAEINVVPADADGIGVDIERLLDAIDERTLLVPVSHVLFKSGFVQDIAAIVEKAERVGAYVVADLYQSAGVMPIDVTRWGVHFAVGGSVKWLCGGPGVAYLYVRPDLLPQLCPRLTGWMAHEAPFAFEPGPIRYAQTAFRMLNGTPHVPALYAAQAGYDLISEIGPAAIREWNLKLSEYVIEQARFYGWRLNCPAAPEQRGGTVILDLPDAEQVVRELDRRRIQVDYRPGAGIRIGPHFYNTLEDCEVFIENIRDILTK